MGIIWIICIFLFLLVVEKLVHKDYSLEDAVKALKQDAFTCIKAIAKKDPKRHVFDVTLGDDITSLVTPYTKKGFEVKGEQTVRFGVPVVWIQFVPEHSLDTQELQDLCQFLSLKFKEYLEYYNVSWLYFTTYSVGCGYVNLYIYYSEWEEDVLPFRNLYRRMVRHKAGTSSGILRDEELEEQLKNVGKDRL